MSNNQPTNGASRSRAAIVAELRSATDRRQRRQRQQNQQTQPQNPQTPYNYSLYENPNDAISYNNNLRSSTSSYNPYGSQEDSFEENSNSFENINVDNLSEEELRIYVDIQTKKNSLMQATLLIAQQQQEIQAALNNAYNYQPQNQSPLSSERSIENLNNEFSRFSTSDLNSSSSLNSPYRGRSRNQNNRDGTGYNSRNNLNRQMPGSSSFRRGHTKQSASMSVIESELYPRSNTNNSYSNNNGSHVRNTPRFFNKSEGPNLLKPIRQPIGPPPIEELISENDKLKTLKGKERQSFLENKGSIKRINFASLKR